MENLNRTDKMLQTLRSQYCYRNSRYVGQDVFAGSNAMKAVGLTTVPILILREEVKINQT